MDLGFQVRVAGQDDAHIDGLGLVASHRLELMGLKEPQQLDLKCRRGSRDLVEKHGAAPSGLELTRLVGHRTGKGAAKVAKQLTLQERLRNRPATYLDKRLVAAFTPLVNNLRDERLAGARGPLHEHGHLRIGDGLDQLEDPEHPIVLPQNRVKTAPPVESFFEDPVLSQDCLLVDGPFNADLQFVINDRLGQVVVRPHLDGFDGAFDRTVAGHHDHYCLGIPLAHDMQQFEAVATGHIDVRNDQVSRLAFQGLEGFPE